VAMLLAVLLILVYARSAVARPDLVWGGWLLLATLAGQAGSGAYLVLSRWGLFGELTHAAVTGLTFTAAAYLCLRVTLGSRPEEAPTAHAPGGRGKLRPYSPERVGAP